MGTGVNGILIASPVNVLTWEGRGQGIRAVGQRRRRTMHIHDWHMLNERRRACACLYPGRLQ